MGDQGTESGLLGALPSEWMAERLGNIGHFLRGGGGSKQDEVDDGLPCVRYGDLYTHHDGRVTDTRSRIDPDRTSSYTALHYGDLLFAGSGETADDIGRSAVNLMRERAYCGGDVIILRPAIEINSSFLGHAADSALSRIQKSRMGRGSTVIHIYAEQLRNMVIPMPPLEEQRRIAEVLDSFDDAIRASERVIAKRRQVRAGLAQELLDAVPDGSTPGSLEPSQEHPHAESPRGTARIRVQSNPNPAQQSPVSRGASMDSAIAEWRQECLGDHAQIRARIGWRGLSASEYVDSGPFLIAGKHIESGAVDWARCDHLTVDRYRESPEIALRIGDVIVSKDGTIGRTARIDALPGPATLNGTMMLVRPSPSLDYRYLSHLLTGTVFRRLVDERVSGSSIPHLFQRDLVSLPISVPPLEEQRRIAEILDTSDNAIRVEQAGQAKLWQLRTGLAEDLLSGRIRTVAA